MPISAPGSDLIGRDAAIDHHDMDARIREHIGEVARSDVTGRARIGAGLAPEHIKVGARHVLPGGIRKQRPDLEVGLVDEEIHDAITIEIDPEPSGCVLRSSPRVSPTGLGSRRRVAVWGACEDPLSRSGQRGATMGKLT